MSTGEFGIGIANPLTKFHIDGGATALIANLDANVSVAKSVSFRSDNSSRINLEVSGTESGSNAGADFFIRRYSDAGALIDSPLTITRSTGAATFSNTISMGSTLTIGNQGGVDTTIITGGTGFGSRISFNSPAGIAGQITGNGDTFFNIFTGNVGIGNNTPAYKFDVTGVGRFNGANYLLRIDGGGTSRIAGTINNTSGTLDWGLEGSAGGQLFTGAEAYTGNIGTSSNTKLNLCTNSTVRATITTGGNVGIGTTDPGGNRLSVRNATCVVDITSTTSTNFNALELKNGGGSFYVGQDSSTGGFYGGGAYSGCLYVSGAYPMTFFTNGAVRAKILQDGQFCMNTSVALTAGWLSISVPSDNYNAIVLRDSGTSYSGSNFYQLFTNSTNSVAGSISHPTATTVSYNTSSDYRLKEDFKDFNGLHILSNIKFYDFKWKDEDKRMHGVIAHELEPLLPLAVSGTKDAIDKEGNIVAQGVDYSKIVPILGKAIQELKAEIEFLKAKIK